MNLYLRWCYPKKTFCGRVGLLSGTKMLNLIDFGVNLILLVLYISLRPLIRNPPNIMKNVLWYVFLLLMDLLLYHGLTCNKLVALVIWQTVFLFHLILLIFCAMAFAGFAMPQLDSFVTSMTVIDTEKENIFKGICIVIFTLSVIYIPFLVYLYRMVNGIKYVFRQVSLEELATRTSQRILVNGQSQRSNSRTAQFGRFSSGKKYHEHEEDRKWFHQDICAESANEVGGGIPETSPSDSMDSSKSSRLPVHLPSQPIYYIQDVNPMQPFMPAYRQDPPLNRLHRLDSISSYSFLSVSSSSLPNEGGFILPGYYTRRWSESKL